MRDEKSSVRRGCFISRPNRFVVLTEIDGDIVKAHMPNPGRMRELLFPGTVLYVRSAEGNDRRTSWRVIGVEREGKVIPLDTLQANETAEWLVNHGKILGWEGFHVIRREIIMGDSRFDLLLGDAEQQFPVEVKSCTLFGQKGAMFPDAVTARGKKHILHLGELGKHGRKAGLLILVQWDQAEWFLPNYHRDPEFAEAFRRAWPYIDCKVVALCWNEGLTVPDKVRMLSVPLDIMETEAGNHGDYLLVVQLQEPRDIDVGSLGQVHFPKGWYVYLGSARKNLDQRMARHRRLRKGMHWHIDWLRKEAQWAGCIPIRTKEDLEHRMACALRSISDWQIPGFGCTDCQCESHLFGFRENPLHTPAFVRLEEDFTINRLDQLIKKP